MLKAWEDQCCVRAWRQPCCNSSCMVVGAALWDPGDRHTHIHRWINRLPHSPICVNQSPLSCVTLILEPTRPSETPLSYQSTPTVSKLPPKPPLHYDTHHVPPSRFPNTQTLLICTYQTHSTSPSCVPWASCLLVNCHAWVVVGGSLLLTDHWLIKHWSKSFQSRWESSRVFAGFWMSEI